MNLFDNPARQTFVLEMVGKEDLPNAVSLNSVVMNSPGSSARPSAALLIAAGRTGRVLPGQRRILTWPSWSD